MKEALCIGLIGMALLSACHSEAEEDYFIVFHKPDVHTINYNVSQLNEYQLRSLPVVQQRLNDFLGSPFISIVPTEEVLEKSISPNCMKEFQNSVSEIGCMDYANQAIIIRANYFDMCSHMMKWTYEQCFQASFIHETLHSLGFDHVVEPGIMTYKIAKGFGTNDFTDADKQECKRADSIWGDGKSWAGHICSN